MLLRRLIDDPLLAGTSHVVVDEVHERSLDSDFLLVLLRDALPRRPGLRVVLMSATLDAAAFSKYFGGAAVMKIPGFTHPVQAGAPCAPRAPRPGRLRRGCGAARRFCIWRRRCA